VDGQSDLWPSHLGLRPECRGTRSRGAASILPLIMVILGPIVADRMTGQAARTKPYSIAEG